MIKTLYQVGKAFEEDPEYAMYFKPWQNPLGNQAEGKVIYLNISGESKNLSNIEMVAYLTFNLGKYVYRDPSGPRGTNLTPSFKYYHVTKEEDRSENLKKFFERMERTLDNNEHIYNKYVDIKAFIAKTSYEFEEYVKAISDQGSILVVLKFDGQYPGEIDEIKDLLFAEAYDKYKETKKTAYVGLHQVCAVTQKQVPEVWGKISLLGFTVDDEAFLRGGFNDSDAWKMFPVDKEIVPLLEGAKELVFDKLRNNFYGVNFLVIPKFIGWEDEQVHEATEQLFERDNNGSLEDITQGIISNESNISHIAEAKNFHKTGVSVDFFFYEQNQAQMAIKAHFSDVMPSRLGVLHRTMKKVTKYYEGLFNIVIPAKKNVPQKTIRTGLKLSGLKDFFATNIGKNTIYQPSFYAILEAVFYQKQIPAQTFYVAYMNAIYEAFKNYENEPFRFSTLVERSFSYLRLFQQLNIIQSINPITMNDEFVALEREAFMEQHKDYLGHPIRRGAFQAGLLVEKLLEAQRKHLKTEPFRKHLMNLHLDKKRLMDIMVKCDQKMVDYQNMEEFKYLGMYDEVKAETMSLLISDQPLDKIELSYAFTLGMVMQKAFAKESARQSRLKKEAKEQ